MIKIENWMIPFVGYKMMTAWPFLFVRDDLMTPPSDIDFNHEEIHGRQQKEMLVVGAVIGVFLAAMNCGWWSLLACPIYFYWYVLEWIIRLIVTGFSQTKAYYNISFEQEAYSHEGEMDYYKKRRPFSWLSYLLKQKNYENEDSVISDEEQR